MGRLVALERLHAGAAGVELRGRRLALRPRGLELRLRRCEVGGKGPILGRIGVELHADLCHLRHRGVEQRTNVGQLLLRGAGDSDLPAAFRFRFHPRGVDVAMRFDCRVEIVIGGVGALGLALHVSAQGVGLGSGVGQFVAESLELAVDVRELVPERLGVAMSFTELAAQRLRVRVRVSELVADRLGLSVRFREIGALRFSLGFRFGEVGEQYVRLRLQLGEGRRQTFGALSLDPQLFVRGVERRPRLGLRLFGGGARLTQSIVELRSLGTRGVEVTRQPRGFGNCRVEQTPALAEIALGRGARVALLPRFILGFEPLGVDVSVGLDRGVEIAVERLGALDFLLQLLAFLLQLLAEEIAIGLGVVEDTGEALVLGALDVEVVLHRLHGGLRFLLYLLCGDTRGRPGGRVEFADELLDFLVGFRGWRAPFLDASRRSFERLAKSAELLYGRLHLAHEQPVDESGRFLCGVVAKFHWGRGRCGPANHANAGTAPKTRNSAQFRAGDYRTR